MRERNRVEAERDRVMIDRDALQAELERSQRQVEEESETAKRFAAERDMLLVERDKIEAELAKVTHELEAILAKAREAADAEAAIKANVYAFMGYAIPIDLMFMTGGGPATFDTISRQHLSNIAKYVGIEPHLTVLEIGCGIGRDAIPLTQLLKSDVGGHYIGIDIIRKSIDWCVENIQAKNPHFIFHHMNIADQLHNPSGAIEALKTYLPVPNCYVDRVIMQSVFTHMLRAEVEYYLAEIRRVLKDNGLAYITVFRYNDDVLAVARRTNLTPFDLRFEHEIEPGCRVNDLIYPTGAVAYSPELLDEMIAKVGLRHAHPPLRGAWSGYHADPQDGQDVLILGCA